MKTSKKKQRQKLAHRSLRSKRSVWLCLVVAGAISALAAWWFSAPAVPTVDTQGFDTAIRAAITDARKAASRARRSAAARGRLGMVLFAHDVRAPARECFEQAAALDRNDPRWPYFLGLAQLVDAPETATTNLHRAVRLFPANETVPRLKLADALLNVGRLDEAEPHYRAVWQRSSNSAPAALGLSKIAAARDRISEAAELLPIAARDPSTRKAAHRLLVSVSQRLGKTNEAEHFARVLTDLPNDTPMHDPFFAEVEQLRTGEKVWIDIADDLIKNGRHAEAARLLTQTIERYPKSDRAMFFLGRARFRLGDLAGAEEILSRAVTLAPESVEAQMQLGIVRMNRGRRLEAQPCFRAAIQAQPHLPEGWYNLGLSLGAEARTRSEAIAAFREAIRLKPTLAEAYLALAVTLRADGQNAVAVEELNRALRLDPDEALRRRIMEQIALAQRP